MSLIRLEVTPLSTLVGEIVQERSSGTLTVVRQKRWTIAWAQGELAMIIPGDPAQSFWEFLVARKVIGAEQAASLRQTDPHEIVPTFQSLGLLDAMKRQSLLREWMRILFIPLFSFDEGTAAFNAEEAIEPSLRILLQSTSPLIVEGIRAISNGLVLRHAVGDLKRIVAIDSDASYSIETLPLTDGEMRIASSIKQPEAVESILKRFSTDSQTAAKVVIMLTTLGVLHEPTETSAATATTAQDDPQRDLELLAAIGPNDTASLRAVALSRSMREVDFYRFVDMPQGSTSSALVERCEKMKREYDVAKFPPPVREHVRQIAENIDRALATFSNPIRRHEYDEMLARGYSDPRSVTQQIVRRHIAQQNLDKARDLSIMGDYYGAIVLLRQSVNFNPSNAEAWLLLGNCQEKNPKWRRDAANSYHKALAVDPNSVDTLLSLGDLYRSEGLAARAQSFYEDVLKIDPENEVAKKRMKALK